MRSVLALVAGLVALLAIAAPVATAQLAQPLFGSRVEVPSALLDPGNATVVTLHLDRTCPNAATVLPAQSVTLQVSSAPGGRADGPGQVEFMQQVCAQQMRQEQAAQWTVTILENATRGAPLPLTARFQAQAADQLTPKGPEQSIPFVVQVSPAPAAVTSAAPIREQPAPGLVLLAVALAGVVALRRRT